MGSQPRIRVLGESEVRNMILTMHRLGVIRWGRFMSRLHNCEFYVATKDKKLVPLEEYVKGVEFELE